MLGLTLVIPRRPAFHLHAIFRKAGALRLEESLVQYGIAERMDISNYVCLSCNNHPLTVSLDIQQVCV